MGAILLVVVLQGPVEEFYFFHSDGCAPCAKMISTTLSDTRVKRELSRFKQYKINVSVYGNFAQFYKVRGVPTYMIVSRNSKVKILKRGVGYRSPDEFIKWLQQ